MTPIYLAVIALSIGTVALAVRLAITDFRLHDRPTLYPHIALLTSALAVVLVAVSISPMLTSEQSLSNAITTGILGFLLFGLESLALAAARRDLRRQRAAKS